MSMCATEASSQCWLGSVLTLHLGLPHGVWVVLDKVLGQRHPKLLGAARLGELCMEEGNGERGRVRVEAWCRASSGAGKAGVFLAAGQRGGPPPAGQKTSAVQQTSQSEGCKRSTAVGARLLGHKVDRVLLRVGGGHALVAGRQECVLHVRLRGWGREGGGCAAGHSWQALERLFNRVAAPAASGTRSMTAGGVPPPALCTH